MTQVKEPKFEDALRAMEDIVEKLESGDLTLDQSLKLYEEGMKMSQSCSKRLEQAQKKIETLTRSTSGELKTSETDSSLKSKKKTKSK